MITFGALRLLLGIEPGPGVDTVYIYTENPTPRLRYTCDFIFSHVLNINAAIEPDHQRFKQLSGPRINYSSRQIDNALRIEPAGLISSAGVNRMRPQPEIIKDCFYLFRNGGDLGFDVFSAVFYLVSRYEEWQDYTKDRHQRFEANQSILYLRSYHLRPVVDLWIMELKMRLSQLFPELTFPAKRMRIISTIDVDNLYAYKRKGIGRTLGASARDVIRMDLQGLRERIEVLSGRKKDPFDIYEEISDFCFQNKIPLIYFFLFRSGTRNDRTVDPRSGAYDKVFRTISDNKAFIGIHPSYQSGYDEKIMKREVELLRNRNDQPVEFSRQHFLRFDIRHTPRFLMDCGIKADFSMGYATEPGFRAGTSHAFYYYDFNSETAGDLLFVPFCVMDGAYTVYGKADPDTALNSMLDLAEQVRKVDGVFLSVFHERSFSDHLYKGFGTLYKKLHLSLSAPTPS